MNRKKWKAATLLCSALAALIEDGRERPEKLIQEAAKA